MITAVPNQIHAPPHNVSIQPFVVAQPFSPQFREEMWMEEMVKRKWN